MGAANVGVTVKPACKNRSLKIGNVTIARTPIALPSFSSEALASDLADTTARIGEFVAGPILISAFDLHHGYLPAPAEGKAVFNAPLTFIDSGGYENLRVRSRNRRISLDQHASVLESWPESAQTVAVNFDFPSDDIGEQLAAANSLCPSRTIGRELLIKPGKKVALAGLIGQLPNHRSSIASIDVVGLTEKEAGGTLQERLRTIGKLRAQLDNLGFDETPIHLFGGLDPLRTPLYFLAGADIFDGLSWLRYGFTGGHAVYLEAFATVEYPQSSITDAEWRVRRRNFNEVTRMQTSMLRYLATSQPTDLHPLGDRLVKLLAEAGDD